MTSYQLFAALPSHIEDALRASIDRFGVLVPVTKDQHGNVIDGHHRMRIADTLGVKYRVDVVQVASEDDAREIARSLNADRRQLTEDQRRAVAVDLRQKGHSLRAIAGAVGVSQQTVMRDIRREEEIVPPGTIDQPERVVRQGGGSYPARRPTVVAAKNERESERAQQALTTLGADTPAVPVLDVKRAERAARETEADRRRAEPVEPTTITGAVDIRHGDFRTTLADLTDVDAIITDPPYPGEYRPLFADLAALAAKILTPNGVLAVMCGQYYLPDYITLMSEHLAYRWCGAYLTQGPRTRVHAAKVGTGWKPILLFQRHNADPAFILDDLFDSAGDDKRHHHWGQSESGIAALVERLTAPGALVVDPFLGGGTAAVVCRDLGRRFVGCDIDAGHVATSRQRVA